MQDINSVVIVGRITRDSELRYTANGGALCNFCIASNRSVKKGDQWADEASFFDLTLWGKQAEGLNKYLIKGTQVAIKGSLKQERWTKDGENKSKLAIHVEDIQLIGGRREGGSTSNSDQLERDRAEFDRAAREAEDPPF